MGRKTKREELMSLLSNKRAFIVKKVSPEPSLAVSRWCYVVETADEVEAELKKDTIAGATIVTEAIYPAFVLLTPEDK